MADPWNYGPSALGIAANNDCHVAMVALSMMTPIRALCPVSVVRGLRVSQREWSGGVASSPNVDGTLDAVPLSKNQFDSKNKAVKFQHSQPGCGSRRRCHPHGDQPTADEVGVRVQRCG